jgi:biotin-(acetyl-CoA carboxylase) ligase
MAAAAADDAKKLAEEVMKLHMELEELQQQGVHVIVRDGDQYAAVIGERMLHVGDKINDFTVTAIDPDGSVHIEKKDSP